MSNILPPANDPRFPAALADARVKLGISAAELARRANISPTMVARYENTGRKDHHRPRQHTVTHLEKALRGERVETAPRGSCMASGTLVVPAAPISSTPVPAADPVDEDVLHLAREALERAAETFSSVKEGHHFDRRRRDHLRLAITALQHANSGLVPLASA